MTLLTRRELFVGTAATTAALSLGLTPSQLFAAAPPAGKQAASFYRYKVGDFEVTQIADGARTFPMPDQFVVNQKKEDALAAAEAAYIPKGQVTIPFNPTVVNTGSKLVVIDTGNGLGAFEQTKGAVGQMNANMLAAGLDPKNVDIVVISHFHGDHMNGLKKADGSLV
jgi:glyoxylase-like metal-dependent hydrolase (beta-lactamase superfamily II)